MEWYERAKDLLQKKGSRQEDLIPVLKVQTRGAVGHYLSGRRQPDPQQITALANYLGVSLDYLMGNMDESQAKILAQLKAAKDAMNSLGREFTKEQQMHLYRVALTSSGDNGLSEEQMRAIIEAVAISDK